MKCKLCSILTVLLILSGIVQAQSQIPFGCSRYGKIITDNVTTSKQLHRWIVDKSTVGNFPIYFSLTDIDFSQAVEFNTVHVFKGNGVGYVKSPEFLNPNRIQAGVTPYRFLWCSPSELLPFVRPVNWSSISQLISNSQGLRVFICKYNNVSEEYMLILGGRHQRSHLSKVDRGQKFVVSTITVHPLRSESLCKDVSLFGVDWLETEIPREEQEEEIEERIAIMYSSWSAQDFNLKHCLEQPKMNLHETSNN